ncbi:TOMM precursor leader peptide-binding protein [Actinokineospora auranticolor]|uniref:Ribosomal protein S12 methylthiotransferase accessory factor n=1 Tax=Actinokineospora auranticolor TaxID=155976 RepID=A0A2S6GET0_9PSEU|nr:TOMM precursor leader peptide-binding protein [Actinokineospora auranticolor]PPK63724.1 ribosomal protein S12 methylthiotransferase accessory factor [Actinokineospora auranticolor]
MADHGDTAHQVTAGFAELLPTGSRAFAVRALGLRDAIDDGDGDEREPGAVPVHLYGDQVVVGPFPDAPGACARCLARRWQATRPVPLRDALELGGPTAAPGTSPHALPFTADLAAAVAAAHEAGRAAAEPYPVVYLVDPAAMSVRRYPLVPDPECPRCGDRRADAPAAPEWERAPKPGPGVFRTRRAADIGVPAAAFINPVTGALGTALEFDVSSPTTSPVTGHFTLRATHKLRETYWGGHEDDYAASARVGVLEGLERHAGMRPRAKRTVVVDTLAALGGAALDPAECGLYADAFHDGEPGVAPFTPDRPIPWVWGYSLRDERPVLVPEVLTYYHSRDPAERFVQESSNGCASGSSLTEAVYFGLLEVVERDAFLLAWYGGLSLPELRVDGSAATGDRLMVERMAMYGYRARFFDTRITFDIPVVTAVATRADGGLGALCCGAGASLDPARALGAALREIATDSVNLPGRTRRNQPRLRRLADDFDLVVSLHDHPFLYGLPEMTRHARFLLDTDAPPTELSAAFGAPRLADDLRTDLARCVDEVTAHGFDVIAVDQTSPEQERFGLRTASVLVPGLLPLDFGWRRQRARTMARTRTAPRAAGLLDRDLRPDELTPAPHPFP